MYVFKYNFLMKNLTSFSVPSGRPTNVEEIFVNVTSVYLQWQAPPTKTINGIK